MKFLKRINRGEWFFVEPEVVVSEVSNEQMDMMIWFKATIRIGACQYRRYIPTVIRDWALINS